MEYILNKKKLYGVFQTLIESFFSNMKSLKNLDWRQIPDDISSDTWDDIDNIISFKISNIEITENKYVSSKFIVEVTIDIVYDSVTNIHLEDILWDVSQYLKDSTGLDILLIEGEVKNNYLDYGQW